jgi:hypothetical protein
MLRSRGEPYHTPGEAGVNECPIFAIFEGLALELAAEV